ncbi:hypothetical protein NL676_027935 [Syzygium grande]|nr:hypothetical protein NL676_027935 [Syzygium grande]
MIVWLASAGTSERSRRGRLPALPVPAAGIPIAQGARRISARAGPMDRSIREVSGNRVFSFAFLVVAKGSESYCGGGGGDGNIPVRATAAAHLERVPRYPPPPPPLPPLQGVGRSRAGVIRHHGVAKLMLQMNH